MAYKIDSLLGVQPELKDYLREEEKLTSQDLTANGTILEGAVAYLSAAETATAGTIRMTGNVLGVNTTPGGSLTTKDALIGWGVRDALAGSTIAVNDDLVVTTDGRVAKRIATQTNINAAITGAAFTNQPADDGVTIVSDSTSDTTQTVTIYGTTSGAETTVVSETVTLNGTTDVDTVKDDWGTILGVVISASCAGTIEVSETSGGLEIVSITTGNLSAGVTTASASNAYGDIPRVVASDTTTKLVGIIGTAVDGTALNVVTALTNATEKDLDTKPYATVTTILSGNVEATRTFTVKTATADAHTGDASDVTVVGQALEAGTAGSLIKCLITPNQ